MDLARLAEALERAQRHGARPGVGGHLIRRMNAAVSAVQALQDVARGARAGRDDPIALGRAVDRWTETRDALAESASVALSADDGRMVRAGRKVLAMLDGEGAGR